MAERPRPFVTGLEHPAIADQAGQGRVDGSRPRVHELAHDRAAEPFLPSCLDAGQERRCHRLDPAGIGPGTTRIAATGLAALVHGIPLAARAYKRDRAD
ncbi:MAG: hypothetical protein Q6365_015695, partial [Candidatus Sigynarchaeota archaeon]